METGNRNDMELFGSNVFTDREMKRYLSKEDYEAFRRCVDEGIALDRHLADVMATAMKDWAVEKGATHYFHWFFPLTGSSAEKRMSFLDMDTAGKPIAKLSGKMLIQGEADASSFPSGGLRATFEARGYTIWDPTSPVFLKEDRAELTLCIPTAYGAWSGEALDEKTPLLRSHKALSREVLRFLRLFGDLDSKKVITYVGPEQEYFLVDLEQFMQRKDLVLTGRTLFGAKPAKTQELSEHYYSGLKERISAFMKEIDIELWKMGIYAKTKHNEAAPCQHELAVIHSDDNSACDHNQLLMETLRKVALRHNLVCLLHEKPFDNMNGSGKHDNFSIGTDTGINLFEPGENPYENARFLLVLCAVIQGVDEYAGLLRATVASASNDCRLGGFEAPPAIISICLGEEMTAVLENIAKNTGVRSGATGKEMNFGLDMMPKIFADASDRNRTSPFAFTGNKFEFRMPGSSQPIGWVNTVLNSILAKTLGEFSDRLEKADDFDREIRQIITDVYEKHGRILYNGNGYSEQWAIEAADRGLPILRNTAEATRQLTEEKAVRLLEDEEVYSRDELKARQEITFDLYYKNKVIEARTMVEMASKSIAPAVVEYLGTAAKNLVHIREVGATIPSEEGRIRELSSKLEESEQLVKVLREQIEELSEGRRGTMEKADYCADVLEPSMHKLRMVVDAMETLCDEDYWPIPTYYDLLFQV